MSGHQSQSAFPGGLVLVPVYMDMVLGLAPDTFFVQRWYPPFRYRYFHR